ncbi:hypothetical protein ROZALSC1DRAFT_24361 [Rozella allomycis CSF55]|uniref:Uncharacterized protein n=1 Tax=Rozella allomycis (strain CSF55) TaxID=988480 RepID=A0A4P9YEE6_ROZAC|nr:hypothetical protein ROZALSC1DRAFT_24361 [Rozella allomycis CSF55]
MFFTKNIVFSVALAALIEHTQFTSSPRHLKIFYGLNANTLPLLKPLKKTFFGENLKWQDRSCTQTLIGFNFIHSFPSVDIKRFRNALAGLALENRKDSKTKSVTSPAKITYKRPQRQWGVHSVLTFCFVVCATLLGSILTSERYFDCYGAFYKTKR